MHKATTPTHSPVGAIIKSIAKYSIKKSADALIDLP
jgi:hypothetical protein